MDKQTIFEDIKTYLKRDECDGCKKNDKLLAIGYTNCGNAYNYLCKDCVMKIFQKWISDGTLKNNL